MNARLIFPILILTLAGLACNLPMLASTPPAAASPSPTLFVPPAATATPTLLAASHYFFEEEFDSELTGWSTVVTSGDVDLLDLQTKNGALVFDIGDQNLTAFSFFQTSIYKNVWIDLRVTNRGGTEHAVNIVCRYNKEEGWYQFQIFNSGLFNLYYMSWDDNLKPEPILLAKGVSDAMRFAPASNDLSVICNGRALSLYVNGKLAVSYEENQYVLPAGQIGIGVSSFDEIPVVVQFDWMKLETP